MWLIFKVGVSLLAFVIRFFAKYLDRSFSGKKQIDGVECYIQPKSNKHGVYATAFKAPFKFRSIFKITNESKWDAFFKRLDLANEVQSGDPTFDNKFYIASDCPAFRNEIKLDADTRALVTSLFAEGCEYIACDGSMLTAYFPKDRSTDAKLASSFIAFFRRVIDLDQRWVGFFKDPFALKVLFIEAVIWSITCYAAMGFFEWNVYKADVHLNEFSLMSHGATAGLFIAAVIIGFIVIFMRGSSRGHRIIVESIILLLISLPVGGTNLISDINTSLDQGEPVVLDVGIQERYQQVHRGRRGSTTTTYHLQLRPMQVATDIEMPRHLRISLQDYLALANRSNARITIGRGYLKHPWIRSIQPL